ncbi:DUF4384 domain-containing protein [Reichenbachiella versicolor]|uniref:DUF4384 domain-containing protein n=1 Tax=Reichenbachiella versicolor TaxID=1821036 RepID=UPI000D6E0BF8|nr:DUF4384 domain-containing protein [Reichenbachiella versicolor]
MKNSLIAFLLIFSNLASFAQEASWTNYSRRNAMYPESKYLTGFSSELIVKEEPREDILERLSGYAKDKLVQSIVTDIQSTVTLEINTSNGTTNEDLKSASVSAANATIAGLKVETYISEGKKEKTAYAFAYAKKTEVIQYYENAIKSFIDKFNSDFGIVENHISQGNNQKALKILFGFQTDFREIEHAQMILVTLTGNYNLPSTKRSEINSFKAKVEQKINSIRSNQQFSLEDAAYYIAFAMSTQLTDKSTPISINNFTYEDTPMGSPFSRRLKFAIEQKLTLEGFSVTNNAATENDILVLNGTYWEESDKLKIVTILRSKKDSKAVSSSECYLPKSTLINNGIVFKPENYKQALINMKEFAANEVTGGNLNIEIWTNKGKDNLIYTEGEILKLFVRANKECYLRIVYYLADGSKVLLLDNYYINRDLINKTYELPYEFECAEPFGVETLQMNAQDEPFEELYTEEQYGYEFITEGIAAIQVKSRGFKRVKSTSTEEVKAEKRLVFTTMRR